MNAPELPTAPEPPAVVGPVQRRVSRQPAALPHPYWADDAVTLYHGDALELLPLLPEPGPSRPPVVRGRSAMSFARPIVPATGSRRSSGSRCW